MTLVLRMCKSDGSSSNGFFYGKTGDRVTCPDWRSQPVCGYGLHGLKEGNGDWLLLDGEDWLIIDADDQIVDIDECKCKFNTGIILFRGTQKQLANSEFPSKLNLNSKSAYQWAQSIGNKDIMIDKITDSESAYYWALNIGDKDVMINKITNPKYAYYWAYYIGNHDVMINKINSDEYAYYWARFIGNRDIMKLKLKNNFWIKMWNYSFHHDMIEM